MRPIVNELEEDRATAIGNTPKKLAKIARGVLEKCCQTDRQTDSQTHSLQYLATALAGEVKIRMGYRWWLIRYEIL